MNFDQISLNHVEITDLLKLGNYYLALTKVKSIIDDVINAHIYVCMWKRILKYINKLEDGHKQSIQDIVIELHKKNIYDSDEASVFINLMSDIVHFPLWTQFNFLIKELMQYGASYVDSEEFYHKCIMKAAICENYEAIDIFFSVNPNLDVATSEGNTIVHLLAEVNVTEIASVRIFLKRIWNFIFEKMDSNQFWRIMSPNERGLTPLMIAGGTMNLYLISKFIDRIDSIDSHSDLYTSQKNGYFLHWYLSSYARQEGYMTLFKKVLRKQFDLDIRDIFQRTPLVLALKSNALPAARLLILNNCNLNIIYIQDKLHRDIMLDIMQHMDVNLVNLAIKAGYKQSKIFEINEYLNMVSVWYNKYNKYSERKRAKKLQNMNPFLKQYEEVYVYMTDETSNIFASFSASVLYLKELCRIEIRKHLKKYENSIDITIENMKLPLQLKDYISLKEFR